jgi:hypothetical protein
MTLRPMALEVPEPMQFGDVLAFHALTVHGTHPATRERYVRYSVDMRYSDADAARGLRSRERVCH